MDTGASLMTVVDTGVQARPGTVTKWTLTLTDFAEPPLKLEGSADHWNYRKDDDDYYAQPGKLFRLMTPAQKKILFENTAHDMGDAPKEIKVRHIGNCLKADPAYGKGVADARMFSLNENESSPE